MDERFLPLDTSSVTFDIYAATNLHRHPIVGTARVVFSSLSLNSSTTPCVALQVRRSRSIGLQGINNIGITILYKYIHNMPLDHAFVLKDMGSSPNRNTPRMPSSLASTSHMNILDEGEEWGHESAIGKQQKLQRNSSMDASGVDARRSRVMEQERDGLLWVS